MPYKHETDKLRLKGLQDRRRKLTNTQKEEIRKIYATGTVGQRPLAKQFGVSRSLIQIIVNPVRAEKTKQRSKEHWKDYHNRKKLTKAIRETRRYKQQLYLKGELKDERRN